MCDLEFDLSRLLKVTSNGAVGFPIYNFLLVSNSKYMSILNRSGVIATRKNVLLSLTMNSDEGHPPPYPTPPHPPPLPRGDFFQNPIVSSLGQMKGCHQKWSWSVQYVLRYFVNHTQRQTDRQTDKCKVRNPAMQIMDKNRQGKLAEFNDIIHTLQEENGVLPKLIDTIVGCLLPADDLVMLLTTE